MQWSKRDDKGVFILAFVMLLVAILAHPASFHAAAEDSSSPGSNAEKGMISWRFDSPEGYVLNGTVIKDGRSGLELQSKVWRDTSKEDFESSIEKSNVTVSSEGAVKLKGDERNLISDGEFTSSSAWTFKNGTAGQILARWDSYNERADLSYQSGPLYPIQFDPMDEAGNWTARLLRGGTIWIDKDATVKTEGSASIKIDLELLRTTDWAGIERGDGPWNWMIYNSVAFWINSSYSGNSTPVVYVNLSDGATKWNTGYRPLSQSWRKELFDITGFPGRLDKITDFGIRFTAIDGSATFFVDDITLQPIKSFTDVAHIGQAFVKTNLTSDFAETPFNDNETLVSLDIIKGSIVSGTLGDVSSNDSAYLVLRESASTKDFEAKGKLATSRAFPDSLAVTLKGWIKGDDWWSIGLWNYEDQTYSNILLPFYFNGTSTFEIPGLASSYVRNYELQIRIKDLVAQDSESLDEFSIDYLAVEIIGSKVLLPSQVRLKADYTLHSDENVSSMQLRVSVTNQNYDSGSTYLINTSTGPSQMDLDLSPYMIEVGGYELDLELELSVLTTQIVDFRLSIDNLSIRAPAYKSGFLLSRIFDASSDAILQNVNWSSFLPRDTGILVRLRTGGSQDALGSWLGEYADPPKGLGGVIARYLQYKVEMVTTNRSATPLLGEFSLAYEKYLPRGFVYTEDFVPLRKLLWGVVTSSAVGNSSAGINLQFSVDGGISWSPAALGQNISLSNASRIRFRLELWTMNTSFTPFVDEITFVYGMEPFVEKPGAGNPLLDFLLASPLLTAVLAAAGASSFLLWRQASMRNRNMEDLFLICRDGRLILHNTNRLRMDRDEDALAAMFTAIRHFARDVFKEEGKELKRFSLGDKSVVIESGDSAYLAVIFPKREPKNIEASMKNLLADVEERFGSRLRPWSGDVQELRGIGDVVRPLVQRGKYSQGDWKRRGWILGRSRAGQKAQ